MNPERWAQIEELFHRAAECDPNQRASLLEGACNGDAELRQAVEDLLASEENARKDMQAAVHSGLDAAMFPLVGQTVSQYRILDGLGGGGMGLVYRAEDIKLGRQVALKFLPQESSRNPDAVARFEREARSASALEHLNICPIYEFGEHEGQPFLVMQLLEGQTLRELIASTEPGKYPLEILRFFDLAIQIAEGLEAAHHHGIIHRDIKPANIFVTTQGQVKILDFGLAKLTRSDIAEEESRQDSPNNGTEKGVTHGTPSHSTPDLLLSRTGVAMGTAGYMSPEQARSERLDERTDLFSLGLVLYEMATGQRALQANTVPVVHDSILSTNPPSARQLNPQIPAQLESILHRALERDPARRYQTAGELRSDLQVLKNRMGSGHFVRRAISAAAAILVLLIAGGTYWSSRHQRSLTQTLSQVKFRQLTMNSVENPVSSGGISPNGRYLAYVDRLGIHVKDVETSAIQSLQDPAEITKGSVTWEINDASWFPDNKRFLATAYPANEDPSVWSSRTASIWVFSRIGDIPHMLREHAIAWSVSPDGALISFGTKGGKFGERETWLMDSSGQHTRKLFEENENSSSTDFLWSADSQRGLAIKTDEQGDTVLSRDLHGGSPVTVLTSSETKQTRGDFTWLPDGRLIYQVADPGAESASLRSPQDTCNFWTKRLDIQTGAPIEVPRQLTNWTGFCISSANATADGKRLAFLRSTVAWTVYVADVEAGGIQISNIRHLTLDEGPDVLQSWTNDSKRVLFTSNRAGNFAIYAQPLDSDEPALVSRGRENFRDTPATPDGKWVFGFVSSNVASESKEQLMRIPLAGGQPELVTDALPGNIFCASPPSKLCVLAERTADHKNVIFASVDPLKGRGPELGRYAIDPGKEHFFFSVSPAGTRLAVSGSPKGPIHIIPLNGEAESVIPAAFNNISGEFFWATDGKGLYVSDRTNRGTVLYHLDIHGKKHELWINPSGWAVWANPSPDGRHLAIESSSATNNMWMMENF